MNKDKRFKLIFICIAVLMVGCLSFGIYYRLQPDEVAGLSNSTDVVNTEAETPQINEEPDISAYVENLQRLAKAQQDEYKTVDGKEVELVNEPTPEPEIEYAPRYESKEEAAKNPPPKPTKEELLESSGSNNIGGKTNNNSNTGVNNNNTGSGGNTGGSNLVPPEQNPFLQPGAAATNVEEVRIEDISDHVSGTGDKF